MTKLFTDTSANLPLSLLTAHHIEVLPFSYTVDGKPVPYSETTDFDGKAFYDAMRAGAAVKTSMINTETFREHFTRALEAGDDVLYVGMSGGISGTAGAAALTVRELKEAYPDRKIAAIDTFAASLGEGLQVLDAARMLEEGRTFEEVPVLHRGRPDLPQARRAHLGRGGGDRHAAADQAHPARRRAGPDRAMRQGSRLQARAERPGRPV